MVAAIEEFRKRPNDELIIRVHPAETKLSGRESRETMESAIHKRVKNIPTNVLIIPSDDPTSSYQIMKDADFGLVYSSTTGLEMALTGKPVVVAARTHYRNKGFTIDIDSPLEFSDVLEQLCSENESGGIDLTLARKYAYLFFFRAPYKNLGVSEHIRGLVAITTKDPGELSTNKNEDSQRLLAAMGQRNTFNPKP
jgi:hypothetical protein